MEGSNYSQNCCKLAVLTGISFAILYLMSRQRYGYFSSSVDWKSANFSKGEVPIDVMSFVQNEFASINIEIKSITVMVLKPQT